MYGYNFQNKIHFYITFFVWISFYLNKHMTRKYYNHWSNNVTRSKIYYTEQKKVNFRHISSVISPPIHSYVKTKHIKSMGVQFSVDLGNWNTAATSYIWLVTLGMSNGSNEKNHISNLICSDSCFYRLVWNVEVCSIYSCCLESLTSMCECKLTVVSWRCFLTSRRFYASIDIPLCPNRLMRL